MYISSHVSDNIINDGYASDDDDATMAMHFRIGGVEGSCDSQIR